MDNLKQCPFCGNNNLTKSCCALDYPTCNVMAYVSCDKCGAEISQRGNVKESMRLLNDVVKKWNSRAGADSENDQCQPCHNSLQCLAWAQDGVKAKCAHWDYFKQHYASGNKKIIGAELLKT